MKKSIILFSAIFFSFFTFSQTYPISNTTVTGCSGTFTDTGGTGPGGNYSNNENFTMTFCSPTGGPISLDFTGFGFEVETGFDFLDIYDGTTATGTPMYQSVVSGGTTNPGVITSTTGCLTIQFQSDGSVTYEGWQATISCPTCTDGIQNGNETGIDCGGSECPACPNCFNGIQDGNETGVDCGGSCPEACHCSDGIQNFDETGVDCGGADCFPCPQPCQVNATWEVDGTGSTTFPGGSNYNMSNTTINACGGTFYDPGGNGNYGNNNLNTMTFCSDNPDPTSQIVFDFLTFDVESGFDDLVIYDGPNTSSPVIGTYTGTNGPGTVTSTSGCLTFLWDSDGSVTDVGWVANIGCYIPPVLDCNGGNIVLTADGQGAFTYALNNDFDLGTPGNGWNTNITADFSNPCDPSIDGGTYMWMGNSAPHPRIIETTPLDVSCGGQICFFLDFATQGNASPCEGIDLADEGVYFEYSVDGGATWTTIEYFGPGGVGNNTTGGGTDPQMTSWNNYCFDIPPGAETTQTLFHWAQTGSSGINNDHWGIDNVTIQSLVDCSPYVYDWSQVPGSDDNAVQNETITSTTTYTVTYTNGTDACSTTVTVPVPPGTTADAGPDVIVCEGAAGNIIGGAPVTLDDGATYSWDNGAGSGTIVLSGGSQDNGQVSVAPATTTEYILAVTFNGCTTEDTMLYIVNPLPIVSGGPNVSICNGASTTLTASGADTYTWAPATGLSSTTGTSVVASPVVTTDYTVTGTDANGCVNSAIITVTVDPLDDPSFTLTDFCLGTTNAATITGTTGGTFTFNPAPGDGATIDGVSGSISNGVSGTTYTVEYTTAGACPLSSTQTVSVNPLPVLDVPDFAFCAGAVMTVNESGAGDPSWTYAWTSNGRASYVDASAQTTGISGAVDGEQFTVTVTDANGCVNTDIATLTISGNAPIDAGSDVTICDGSSTVLTGTGGVIYTWDDGTGTLPAGNNITVSPTTTTVYTVDGEDANGCLGTDQVTVTVDPIPTVDPISPQTICANTATTDVLFTGSVVGTTYDWINDNASIGLAASGTGDILSFTGTNTGTTAETATITVTPTANGCAGTPITFTITVDPIPTVDPVSPQTICANTATTDVLFTGSVVGATYDWTNDNTNTGLGASGSGDITSFTGTNTGSVSEVSTITVTPTANGCAGTPITFTITVDPIPTVDPVASQTLCNNPITTDVIFTGAVAGTTYDWTMSDDVGVGTSGTGDILSFTAVNSTSSTIISTVTVTPTSNGCVGSPITFTFTVFPIPNVDPIVDQVLCGGAATTAVVPTGLVAGTTFDWTNDNTSIGLAASGTGNIASFTPTAGVGVEVATITYTPTANGCSGATESFTITVNPLPTGVITGTTAICEGDPSATVTITGSNGTAPYTFEYNLNAGAPQTVTSDLTGVATISVASTPTGIYNYNLMTVTDASSTACSQSQTGTATITVNPLPTPVITGPTDYCTGTFAPLTTTQGYTTYNWSTGASTANINATIADNPITVTVTDANGCSATSAVFTVNENAVITYNSSVEICTGQTATIHGVVESVAGVYSATYTTPSGCDSTSNVTLIVNPLPSVDAGADENVCDGDLVTLNATGASTYVWDDPLVTNGVPYQPSVGSTVLTVTGTDANGCVNTAQVTVTVNVLPTATIAGTTTLCVNDPSATITFTGANGTAPYTFTYNINGAANQTVISTGNTATIAIPTATSGVTNVNLVSVTESALGCSQTQTGTATVTVNPLPTVTIAGDITVCVGDAQPTITFTGGNGTAPYTFTYTINGVAQTPITSVGNTATVLAPTVTAGSYAYDLVSVQDASATACSQAQTGTATVIVNPLPTATITGDVEVCVGAPQQAIIFEGFGGTAPYTFTYSLNGQPSVTVTSNGNIFSLPVFTNVAGTFTYTLQQVQDSSPTGCSQFQTGTATVIVNPLPTATIAGDIDLCVGSSQPTITFTGAGGTSPYTFTYSINGGAAQTVTSTGNTATVLAPTAVAGTYAYTLISVQDASTTACSQLQTGTATVNVNPVPTATITGDAEVCIGASSPVITFTGAGGTAPYTFEYSIDNGPVQTVTSIGGSSATILASTANAGTFTYDLISVTDGSATGCGQPQSGTVTVIVNPLPTATISGDAEVCLNGPNQTITFTGANGVSPYTFTYTLNGGPNQTITSTGNTATITVPTSVVGVTTYSLVGVQDASATGCYQPQTGLASVEVVDLPPIYAGVDFTVCEGDDIVLTASGGTGYVWNGGAIQDGVPFTSTQTDEYVVIGVNPTGCVNSDTVVVTVSPIPLPSFVADTTMGCAPLEVVFTNTTPGGPFTDCIWTLSNGTILNGCGSISYVFAQGGTYDVTLETTTVDGCTAQATYQYYVYIEQPAIADFSASSTVVNTLDSEVQFINESENADGYIWSFGDGSALTTEQNPTHVFPNEGFGTYGVTLIATTPLGCNDTIYTVIRVEEEIIFYVPNTFTPDADDFNPTFQPVFTSGYDPFDYNLLIYNRWGEIVFESHNVEIGWDGTYGVDGQKTEVQDGTYTWTIDFKTVNTDERIYVNGHVNVLR